MTIIQASRRLRQEDCEFRASLGYIMRPCLKKKSLFHKGLCWVDLFCFSALLITEFQSQLSYLSLGDLSNSEFQRYLDGHEMCLSSSDFFF
jgi:hypothetical protein